MVRAFGSNPSQASQIVGRSLGSERPEVFTEMGLVEVVAFMRDCRQVNVLRCVHSFQNGGKPVETRELLGCAANHLSKQADEVSVADPDLFAQGSNGQCPVVPGDTAQCISHRVQTRSFSAQLAGKYLLNKRETILRRPCRPETVSDLLHKGTRPDFIEGNDPIVKVGKWYTQDGVGAPRFEAHADEVRLLRPLDDVMSAPNSHAPAALVLCSRGYIVDGAHRAAEIDFEIERRRWKNLLASVRHDPLHVVQVVDVR